MTNFTVASSYQLLIDDRSNYPITSITLLKGREAAIQTIISASVCSRMKWKKHISTSPWVIVTGERTVCKITAWRSEEPADASCSPIIIVRLLGTPDRGLRHGSLNTQAAGPDIIQWRRQGLRTGRACSRA